ncbi:hypothetical protein TrVE_jg13774 [Triparma verrucosa]|uniref:Sde2 N-terminal ubiquitin domain-containing protein n=1 Tax=Triparma verrucosa TaxID=1606542 RepID=A0A9W7C115_9STRA|nr:hypothetical protein TrVE_jg13774 [Triparma verrucosa]
MAPKGMLDSKMQHYVTYLDGKTEVLDPSLLSLTQSDCNSSCIVNNENNTDNTVSPSILAQAIYAHHCPTLPSATAAATAAILSTITSSFRFTSLKIGLTTFHRPHLLSPLLGGKGGFGALLKAVGKKAGKKKTTDFGACRDLNGRRLRHINDEIKLERWRKAQEKSKALKDGNIKPGQTNDDSDDDTTGIDNWYLGTPTWSEGVSNKEMYKTKKRKRLESQRALESEHRTLTDKETRRVERDARVQEYANSHKEVGVNAEDLQDMVKKAKVRERVMKGKLKQLLEVVEGGEVEVKRGTIVGGGGGGKKGDTVFSTTYLKGETPQTGKWYYEVVVESGKEVGGRVLPIQVGFLRPDAKLPDVKEDEGVGDVGDSVGWDGGRGILIVDGDVNAEEEGAEGEEEGEGGGVTWEDDDVVGVMYDCGAGTINYSLNGVVMPQNKVENVGGGMTMGVSVNTDAKVTLRVAEEGVSRVSYCPEGYRCMADLLFGAVGVGGGGGIVGDEDQDVSEIVDESKESQEVSPTTKSTTTTTTTTTSSSSTTTTAGASSTPLSLSSLSSYTSITSLSTSVPMSVLKSTLQSLGLKAGGSALERATRLWTVKDLKRSDIPMKIRDKKTFDHVTGLLG